MVRDLRRLADTPFDLVVVGAGFYGALAAWDATLRGLSVALIDKGDFGAATSFNNHKTLHGGLRSLQAMNFAQMRLFIRERRALARVAPHLVRVMPFIVPTYAKLTRSAVLMRVALRINDLVAGDRHEGLADPSLQLPPSHTVSRDECLRLNPAIDPAGVTGGAVWHDYQMLNTDRMTLSFILSAAARGASAANYVEATGVIRDNGRVCGVRVEDRLGLETFEVRARTVLNAAGPWAAAFLGAVDSHVTAPAAGLSLAMNLVTRPIAISQACGGLSKGRFLFLIPWRHVSLAGTSHDPYDGGPERLSVTKAQIERFLADVREAFPGAGFAIDDVRLVHRGLLPAVSGGATHVRLLRESTVVDHRANGLPGLISMFGVRYTTARHTAAQAIDAVFADRGVAQPPPSTSAETPVVGGAIDKKGPFVAALQHRAGPSLTAESIARLASAYGTEHGAVLDLMHSTPQFAAHLGERCDVTGAEIAHAVRHESAVKLTDAMIRRTEAGSAGHPGDDAVWRAAAIMADESGWDQARVEREVQEVRAFYALPG